MELRLNVVVPVHDEARALPYLLARLALLRRAPGAEVVVVDGGSTDGTATLLREAAIPWARAPRGRASQMNAGARMGSGDVIMFLHADTELPPDAIEQIDMAVADGAIGGFFRVRLDSDRPLLRLVGWMITQRSRITGIATGDQAIFVTRGAFERLGGFAPLPLFEDVELCSRLRRLGTVAHLPATATTSARRWENVGPLRTVLRMWLLRAGYALGLSPEFLARYYGASR